MSKDKSSSWIEKNMIIDLSGISATPAEKKRFKEKMVKDVSYQVGLAVPPKKAKK